MLVGSCTGKALNINPGVSRVFPLRRSEGNPIYLRHDFPS